jgi:hypothetical protein
MNMSTPQGHIVAMGGGGFSMEPDTGSALTEAVGSRPTASAYRVERRDGRVMETRLPTRYLGGP